MAKGKKQRQREQEKDLAATWSTRHGTGLSEQDKLFGKFRDFFDVLYAVRSTKNIAPWRSKIYIPILAGKAWDFIAKLADIEPRFVATIADEWAIDQDGTPIYPEDMIARAEKMSRALAYDYKNPFQSESPRDNVFSILVDAVATGTGLAKVPWNVTKTINRAHPETASGQVDLESEVVQETEQGHNCLEPVSIFNVIVAPFSHSLQKAPWIIIDGFSTLPELKAAGIYMDDVLNTIDEDAQTTSDQSTQYSVARNRLLGSDDKVAADSSVKLIRTHECYSRDDEGHVVIETYVEASNNSSDNAAWLLIGRVVDPYWHNLYPLQTFYIRRKPYSFWGESLFENNETLQYATNDVLNHYMENLSLSLDGMIMMDENAYVEDFIVGPGEVLIYKNEQPKQFKFPEPNPGQLSMVMDTLDKAVENATVSQYASGTPNSANDSTQGTATGVSKIMEAAEDKLGFMRSNFKSAMEGVGQMWLSNRQQFQDRNEVVPIDDGDTLKPTVISPIDFQGVAAISIDDDSMQPVSQSAKVENFNNWFGVTKGMADAAAQQAQMLGTPEDMVRLDYNNLVKEASRVYGQKVFSEFLQPLPEPKPPETTPPAIKLVESMNYKDLPEDIKRQVETTAGFTPSTQMSPAGTAQAVDASNAAHAAATAIHGPTTPAHNTIVAPPEPQPLPQPAPAQ